MDLSHFSLILSRAFQKAHLDPPLENLDKVFNRMASHVVAMLRDEGGLMPVLAPLAEVCPEGEVDVIFSGDADHAGTLPASAVPLPGDHLELHGRAYTVSQRRWVMDTGRKVAVILTLTRNYGLEKSLADQKDTVTE